MKHAARLLLALMMPLAAGGCRDQQHPAPDDEPLAVESPAVAAGESAGELADRAAVEMSRGRFVAAGELFLRAANAPAGQHDQVSDEHRFDWRCKAALVRWLHDGDPSILRDAFNLDADAPSPARCSTSQPDILASRRGYAVTLLQAMAIYTRENLPADAEARLMVLDIAAGLQLAPPPAPRPDTRISIDGPTLTKLPRALAVWAALDEDRLSPADFQVLAVLKAEPKAAVADLPADSIAFADVIQSRLIPATDASALGEWIAAILRDRSAGPDGQDKNWHGTLLLGVLRRPRVAACIAAEVHCQAGRTRVLALHAHDAGEAARLTAGLRVLASAMPDGATPLANTGQAELVVTTLQRLTGRPEIARVQEQDSFCWVLPPARQSSETLPLVAGWLAGRNWQRPTADSPAPENDDDAEPTNPPEP